MNTLKSLVHDHKGTLKATGWFSVSMLKAMAWGYGLGTVVAELMKKGKSNKTKLLIGIPATVVALCINKLFAWHEAEMTTEKVYEYIDENETDTKKEN